MHSSAYSDPPPPPPPGVSPAEFQQRWPTSTSTAASAVPPPPMPPPGYAHLAHLQPLRPPPSLRQPPLSSSGSGAAVSHAELEASRRWVSDLNAEVQRLTSELSAAQSASASLKDRLKDEQQRNLEKTLQLQELGQTAAKCDQLQATLTDTQAVLDQAKAELAKCRCRLHRSHLTGTNNDCEINDEESPISALLEIKDSIIEKQQAFVKDLERRLADAEEQSRQRTASIEAELASVRCSLAEKSHQLESVLFPNEDNASSNSASDSSNNHQRNVYCRQELDRLRQELQAVNASLTDSQSECDSLKVQLEAARTEAGEQRLLASSAAAEAANFAAMSAEVDRLLVEKSDLTSRLEAAEVKARDLNSLLAYRERLVDEAKSGAAAVREQLDLAKAEAAVRTAALEAAVAEASELKAKMQELEDRLSASAQAVAALSAAEAAKSAAEAELASVKEANTGYELKMKRFASVFQDAKKELETREKLVDRLSQHVKDLRTDNEAKRSELLALKAKLDKRQDSEELLRCSERKLIALERQHAALQSQYDQLTIQLAGAAPNPNSRSSVPDQEPIAKRPKLESVAKADTEQLQQAKSGQSTPASADKEENCATLKVEAKTSSSSEVS